MEDPIAPWRSRLDYYARDTLGAMRTSEMFDIVVDFPESVQALRDLKQCLQRMGTHAAASFAEDFRGQLERRLLHLGAATPVILNQYIASMRALNYLDGTGMLSERVLPLVKAYAKTRKDVQRWYAQPRHRTIALPLLSPPSLPLSLCPSVSLSPCLSVCLPPSLSFSP